MEDDADQPRRSHLGSQLLPELHRQDLGRRGVGVLGLQDEKKLFKEAKSLIRCSGCVTRSLTNWT